MWRRCVGVVFFPRRCVQPSLDACVCVAVCVWQRLQLYRAQQRMGRHLGRGSKLGKADKRRELASAQATALSFQGFQTFLVRLAEQARFQLMHAGGGEVRGCRAPT